MKVGKIAKNLIKSHVHYAFLNYGPYFGWIDCFSVVYSLTTYLTNKTCTIYTYTCRANEYLKIPQSKRKIQERCYSVSKNISLTEDVRSCVCRVVSYCCSFITCVFSSYRFSVHLLYMNVFIIHKLQFKNKNKNITKNKLSFA